jgi:hypothetical protein
MSKLTMVWVNGIRCEGAQAASERASLLLGWKASAIWISRVIKKHGTAIVGGVRISAYPPEAASAGDTRRIVL